MAPRAVPGRSGVLFGIESKLFFVHVAVKGKQSNREVSRVAIGRIVSLNCNITGLGLPIADVLHGIHAIDTFSFIEFRCLISAETNNIQQLNRLGADNRRIGRCRFSRI
jgi:hypothetical protein